jgi:hypothetical protein
LSCQDRCVAKATKSAFLPDFRELQGQDGNVTVAGATLDQQSCCWSNNAAAVEDFVQENFRT